MDATTFTALALACAPAIHPATAQALASVESSFNPHAIGVVGAALERQPRNRAEALATAQQLQSQGWSFSVGLAQINVHNLERLDLSLGTAFDPCWNLAAMQAILIECFERATAQPSPAASAASPLPARQTSEASQASQASALQQTLRRALSCYYSGNFHTGFAHGYVRRVARAMPGAPP